MAFPLLLPRCLYGTHTQEGSEEEVRMRASHGSRGVCGKAGWSEVGGPTRHKIRPRYKRLGVLSVLLLFLSLDCIADTIRISGQLYEDVLIQESENFYDVYVPNTGEVLNVSKQRTDFNQVQIDKDPATRKRLRDTWRNTMDRTGKGLEGGWPLSYNEKKALEAEAIVRQEGLAKEREAREVEAKEALRTRKQAEDIAMQRRAEDIVRKERETAKAEENEQQDRKSRQLVLFVLFWVLFIGVFVLGCLAALYLTRQGDKGCGVFVFFLVLGVILPTIASVFLGDSVGSGGCINSPSIKNPITGSATATMQCFGTPNREDVTRAFELVRSKQSDAFYSMVISGRVVEISLGTSVTVVDSGTQFIQIEVPGRGRVWTYRVWFE